MNPRVARHIALLRATTQGRSVILSRGLFEKTGSLAMCVGFVKPRIVADPRLFGEHRVLQTFIRCHEGAHLVLGHTRFLAVVKWAAILFAAGIFGTIAALTGSIPLVAVACFVGAWVEARHGFLTLDLRRQCEVQADQLALSCMKPQAFASAVRTLDQHKKPLGRWRRFEDAVLNGSTWRDRLRRVGLDVPLEDAGGI